MVALVITSPFIYRETLERRRAEGVGKASTGRRYVAGVVSYLGVSHTWFNRSGKTRTPILPKFCYAISCYFLLFILCLHVLMMQNSSLLSVVAYPSIADQF